MLRIKHFVKIIVKAWLLAPDIIGHCPAENRVMSDESCFTSNSVSWCEVKKKNFPILSCFFFSRNILYIIAFYISLHFIYHCIPPLTISTRKVKKLASCLLIYVFSSKAYVKSVLEKATKCSWKNTEVLLVADWYFFI